MTVFVATVIIFVSVIIRTVLWIMLILLHIVVIVISILLLLLHEVILMCIVIFMIVFYAASTVSTRDNVAYCKTKGDDWEHNIVLVENRSNVILVYDRHNSYFHLCPWNGTDQYSYRRCLAYPTT